MNNFYNRLIFCFSITITLFGAVACSGSKETKKVVKKINDKELRERLETSKVINYDYFYSKIGIDYESSSVNQTAKTTLKMTIDSAFSGTVSYSGFIIANFLATKDSLKATYKQEKCYFTENITYISSIIGVELEYDFFENMLLGKPIGVDASLKYKQIKDKNGNYYILSSHKKRQFKRIEKDKINLEDAKNDDIFMQYYFSPDSLELVKQVIEIPMDTVSITVNYVEKIRKDNELVPEYTTLIIQHPKETIKIGLSYNKQAINKRKSHVFSVPDRYENCNH